MNEFMRIRSALIGMCIVPILLSACGTVPQEYFYTLNPAALPAIDNAEKNSVRYSVAVGPVNVPEMVDRPQLVIRQSANRVDVMEQHRWAQSLRTEIARVVAADLSSQLGNAQVTPYTEYTSRNANYRILIDVEQFDAIARDHVTIQASWSIRRTTGEILMNRHAAIREPVPASGYEALAAAYGRALAALSVEMAHAMLSLQAVQAAPKAQ